MPLTTIRLSAPKDEPPDIVARDRLLACCSFVIILWVITLVTFFALFLIRNTF